MFFNCAIKSRCTEIHSSKTESETVACLQFEINLFQLPWQETEVYMIDFAKSIENSTRWSIPNFKSLPTQPTANTSHTLLPRNPPDKRCRSSGHTLFSWGIGAWSACDPGPFNILGISNGSTMVCYAPGLNCYLDMICQTAQDETCCNRNRKKASTV